MSQECAKIFNWIDPTNVMTDKQRTFYKNKELLDATIIAGPDCVELGAHRFVLYSSSDYFLSAFRSDNSAEIKLPEIDDITMKAIIDFMYTGSIEINVETVRTIVTAAALLQMKGLIDACCDFMEGHLDATNCLGIARFAKQDNYTNLFKKATSFAHKNIGQVSMRKEFTELNEEELIVFISSGDSQSTSIEYVCQKSLVRWVEHDRVTREKNIFDLLYKVLDKKFQNEKGLKIVNTIECYKSFCSWFRLQFEPKSRSQLLVYVSGHGTNELDIHIFNRQLNSWSNEKVPSAPVRKRDYCKIVINKKLIIIGGRDKDSKDTNSVECLDLETKEWYILPPMKNKRSNCGAAELNGDLYVIGGWCNGKGIFSVEKYNFGTGTWQDVQALNFELQGFIRTAVLGGKLYVINDNQDVMHCYDPIKDEWTEKTRWTKESIWYEIAAVGPYIYAVDGGDATVGCYSPSADSWSYVSPLKGTISHLRCTSLNNRLVVCGKEAANASKTITVQEYNPESKEWKILSPFHHDAMYIDYFDLFEM